MSSLNQLREGLSRAWDTVSDGWREIVDRAGDALTRFHPTRPAGELESRETQLGLSGTRWSVLAAEVSVTDQNVEVAMEVPGMDPDDFEIQVVDDVLVIRGHKKVEREHSEGQFHVLERAYGSFERALRLPTPVDDSNTEARYRRGVLRVVLPRSESHKVRRISVQSG